MGCVGYIILVLGTGFLINTGWIVRHTSGELWLAVLILLIIVALIDGLLWVIKAIVQLFAIPLQFLTLGLAWDVINIIFKYFSLWLACSITGWFEIPWIFGPLWWQAAIIAFALTILTRGSDTPTKSSSTEKNNS